jgi:hypothetical protein
MKRLHRSGMGRFGAPRPKDPAQDVAVADKDARSRMKSHGETGVGGVRAYFSAATLRLVTLTRALGPVRWVLIRDPRGEFKIQTLLCTDLEADPKEILCWFVMRWQLEVTFQEMRRHLGFETQRQWSELAIRRTTPALLRLFSLITLFAHQRMARSTEAVRRVAWYRKPHPTFADALALVRKELWADATFCGSPWGSNTVKVPRAYLERLTDAVCYAA